jgi:hypothetical protein
VDCRAAAEAAKIRKKNPAYIRFLLLKTPVLMRWFTAKLPGDKVSVAPPDTKILAVLSWFI